MDRSSQGLWDIYGFKDNPYRFTPLTANAFDDELYACRGDAEAHFASSVTDAGGGVVVISGDVGTGKTSFANVLQHRILNGTAGFGSRPIPSYYPTAFEKGDRSVLFARKVVENTIRSVREYCRIYRNDKVPAETKRYYDWLFGGATQALQVAGMGRTVSAVSAATVEICSDILANIAEECFNVLGVDGLFVCLDNAETLSPDSLAELLKDIRDSLLSIRRIWWIIIGPSDLYSQIQKHNVAVAQRIVGNGIELENLTGSEFHGLIQRRIRAYGKRDEAQAPLSLRTHQLLHDAAAGELRFALKTGHDILTDLNAQMYKFVQDRYRLQGKQPSSVAMLRDVQALLKERMGGADTFSDDHVDAAIERISAKALKSLPLPTQILMALQELSKEPFSLKEFSHQGVGDTFASIEYLDGLSKERVLQRLDSADEPRWALRHHAALLASLKGSKLPATRLSP